MNFNSDENRFLKENLYKLLDGEFPDFTEEQTNVATEVGFILNHITHQSSVGYIKNNLSYNGTSIDVNFNSDESYPFDISGLEIDEYILCTIRNMNEFKLLYQTFLRDYKLSKILK